MREWLTVIIVLLIIGVLLDGLRRMRRARRESLRLSRRARKLDLDDLPDPNTELCSEPRVVRQRDTHDAQSLTKSMRESFAKTRVTVGAPKRIPEQVSLNLEQAVPMLMDSVEEAERTEAVERGYNQRDSSLQRDYTQPPSWAEASMPQQRTAPQQASPRAWDDDSFDSDANHSWDAQHPSHDDDYDRDDNSDNYRFTDSDLNDDEASENERNDDRFGNDWYRNSEQHDYAPLDDGDYVGQARPAGRRSVAEPSLGSLDGLAEEEPELTIVGADEDLDAEQEQPAPRAADKRDPNPAPPEPEEVLIINLMAPAGYHFQGEELLEALVDQGLRFGDMNIFHRHEYPDGSGPVRFSLANMVVPGTFNLATMSEFSTPGVSMFMSLPNEDDSLPAFECMAETAKALAARLGGELKDENRSVMTRQTLEHCRQRVLEFERKQRLMQRA